MREMTLKRIGKMGVWVSIAMVAIGVILEAQPLTLHLFRPGFYVLLAAVLLYTVVSHF